MNIDSKKLTKELKNREIDEKIIQSLIEEAEATNQSLYDVLKRKQLFTDDELGRIIANIIDYPYVDLSKIEIPNEILEIVPENIALKQGIITFGIDEKENRIKIATINPFDLEMIHDLEKKTGCNAEVYYATIENIKNIIGKYNQELKNIFLNMLPSYLRYDKKDNSNSDKQNINPAITEDEINIVKVFDTILLHAMRQHASDIHIEATKQNSIVRYRIDGVLHKVVEFPKVIHESLVTRCKILSDLRIDETRAAQDGRISLQLDNDTIAFRVSILPTHFGEKIVMRLLKDIKDSVGLIDSGLSEDDYKKVITNSTKPYGLMIVAGPTGSGKTTTLYNIIKLLNSEEINIATIEDPIEYGIEGINQVQVNHATNLTFANGLRSLLRQDPDNILVGEIRDQETAQIAVEAAMTGHMVFTTLHANTASVAVPRLIEMETEPFLLTAAINLIIAQRLVRKLCPYCLQGHVYTAETLKLVYNNKNVVDIINKIALKHFTQEEIDKLGFKNEFIFYKSKGCKACGHTGYKGRIGIYEVMELNETLKKAVLEGKSSDEIEEIAIKCGMTTMLEDGIRKAISGVTSLEEVIRVIKN